MEQALLEVFGVTGPYEDIPAAGRTDRAITTDLFAFHGIEPTPADRQRFLEVYLTHLPRSLSALNGSILPGIAELLAELSQQVTTSLGLLTGNFRVAADLKLRHYQIDRHFAYGGFGDDDAQRDDVARKAYRAACEHLQRDIAPESVWVIGDTPSDVTCGRAIGARTIAVATGIFTRDSLHAAQPDVLFDDFSDVAAVLDCLLGS